MKFVVSEGCTSHGCVNVDDELYHLMKENKRLETNDKVISVIKEKLNNQEINLYSILELLEYDSCEDLGDCEQCGDCCYEYTYNLE